MPVDLVLRPIAVADEPQARAAHAELAADGFEFLLDDHDGMSWARYVERHDEIRRGVDLAPDRVRAAFLVAEVGGQLVGRSSIRFTLNEWLAERGGHIGYGVRPAFRRRGYATEILRQSLDVARAEGLDRVLVTCDDVNAASAATIERCGGVFERLADADTDVPKRRYWIDLARSSS